MSVEVVQGNLFQSKADIWVNTVNCRGVMGKGIAKQFKELFRFTDYFADYVAKCDDGTIQPGAPGLFRVPDGFNPPTDSISFENFAAPRFVANFPTKNHWREESSISPILKGIDQLQELVEAAGACSIAIPALGCNNGGLDWAVVAPIFMRKLEQFSASVTLFAPLEANDYSVHLPLLVNSGHNIEFARIKPRPSLESVGLAAVSVIDQRQSVEGKSQVLDVAAAQKLIAELQALGHEEPSHERTQRLSTKEIIQLLRKLEFSEILTAVERTSSESKSVQSYRLGLVSKDALRVYADETSRYPLAKLQQSRAKTDDQLVQASLFAA